MTSPVVAKVQSVWDGAGLLAKAQRYFEEMLRHDRDDWLFAFWSSLTLEVVARAALAHINPTLLADPDDWNNLYYALGNTPTAAKFSPKSIAVTKVLDRLQELIPDFDKELRNACVVHTGKRNAELHSNDTPFDNAKDSEWLPLFYRSCIVLLTSMGKQLRELVGVDEAEVAKRLVDAASDKAAQAVAGTIAAHSKVWSAKDNSDRQSMAAKAASWALPQSGHVVVCPACQSMALLAGSPIAAPTKSIHDDKITERQAFLPSKFECIACGLKISGLSQLTAAGLGNSYKRTLTFDAAVYYGGTDPDDDPEEEEDNNEPY
jgi:hypothetical protein